tara:strand:+ start:548 stop:745 length:198 start_codon:yes stop_codon:yes gene_type:complete
MNKVIKLPNGSSLDVFITPEFLERIKCYFELGSVSEVKDDHIKMFIHRAVDSAVEKAEKNLKIQS